MRNYDGNNAQGVGDTQKNVKKSLILRTYSLVWHLILMPGISDSEDARNPIPNLYSHPFNLDLATK